MKYQTLYSIKASKEQLPNVAKDILNILPKSAIIFLNGNLAAGKTTLVSHIAKELKVGSATSPTFSLQQNYENILYHYDFYRVDFSQITNLGLIDEFEKEALHFVEWGSDELKRLLCNAGFEIYSIDITPINGKREYKVSRCIN